MDWLDTATKIVQTAASTYDTIMNKPASATPQIAATTQAAAAPPPLSAPQSGTSAKSDSSGLLILGGLGLVVLLVLWR
jgi:hypothetical protein